MRATTIRPEFVEFIPRQLEEGVLYISGKFSTASHLCCCGCSTKIVTPLRPTEYDLTEQGGRVSLRPSIGNWNHPCQSHYLITNNQVMWADPMSKEQIAMGRVYDDVLKQKYFDQVAWPWWRRMASHIQQWLVKTFGKKP